MGNEVLPEGNRGPWSGRRTQPWRVETGQAEPGDKARPATYACGDAEEWGQKNSKSPRTPPPRPEPRVS